MASGRRAEGMRGLEEAQRRFPDSLAFNCALAWFRATNPGTSPGDLRQAIEWSRSCCEAEPGNPRHFDALAAAYAASGEYSKAAEIARRALNMVAAPEQEDLRNAIEARLQRYESGQPYHELPR
jgi:tetratricopeptide (TPR) repeat protein